MKLGSPQACQFTRELPPSSFAGDTAEWPRSDYPDPAASLVDGSIDGHNPRFHGLGENLGVRSRGFKLAIPPR